MVAVAIDCASRTSLSLSLLGSEGAGEGLCSGTAPFVVVRSDICLSLSACPSASLFLSLAAGMAVSVFVSSTFPCCEPPVAVLSWLSAPCGTPSLSSACSPDGAICCSSRTSSGGQLVKTPLIGAAMSRASIGITVGDTASSSLGVGILSHRCSRDVDVRQLRWRACLALKRRKTLQRQDNIQFQNEFKQYALGRALWLFSRSFFGRKFRT